MFTAGVGENASQIRQLVTAPLAHFGIAIDPDRNEVARCSGDVMDLSSVNATVRTLVVPTDEEHAIAEQTAGMLSKH